MTKDLLNQLNAGKFPIELPGHFIGGQWGFSGAPNILESRCPSTDGLLASSNASKSDIKTAINCAFEHHISDQAHDFKKRIAKLASFSELFKKHSSELLKAATREQGKPLWEVMHDIKATEDYLDWVCTSGDFIKDQLLGPARLGHLHGDLRQKPAGPIAAYLPFSTTIQSFTFYYVGAVLSNCPVIMFSSKHNLVQASLLANLVDNSMKQFECQAGAFHMILAGFSEFKMALSDRRISAVLYTGSRDHCDEIREDSSSFPERRLILQSGGKNTAIIDEAADMKLAVNAIFQGAFKSGGQLCSSTNRVAIHQSKYDEFKSLCLKALKQMKIGPTYNSDHNPFMGPLFSAKAVERFLRFQTMAAREAEETISWGKAYTPEEDGTSAGNYVKPGIHLMKKIDDTPYQNSVIVCPDIAVYKFANLESGIKNTGLKRENKTITP